MHIVAVKTAITRLLGFMLNKPSTEELPKLRVANPPSAAPTTPITTYETSAWFRSSVRETNEPIQPVIAPNNNHRANSNIRSGT